jgi:membrane-associated phospholipid phosphatase
VTAATSIVLATALVAPLGLRGWVLGLGAVFVFAVGTSVLVLEWHLPSDVLGGVLVALGWGFAVLAGLAVWRERLYSPADRPAARPAPISMK